MKPIIKMKKKLLIALLALSSIRTSAQGTRITQGINEATTEATNWVEPFTNLLWVLAAIVAIAGSYKVFQKYQAQDNDTLKAGMTWAGGFIFIVIANIIIRSVFGV